MKLSHEGIDELDTAACKVCGIARGEQKSVRECGGGNKHVGGVADDSLGGKLPPQYAAAAGDGGRY